MHDHHHSDLETLDLRFPTSRTQAGTDAMHKDPDYSAAYVILKTDGALEGHGLTFTIGRGNEVCVAAIEAYAPSRRRLAARRHHRATSPGFWRRLASESQLRWLGPEKGVIHLALAAIVNAVWDLYAKAERQAALEAAGRHDAAADRVVHRLPLHHRRAHAGRGARHPRAATLRRKRSARPSCCSAAIRPTRPPPAGWAIRTTAIRMLCREALAEGLDALQGQGRRGAGRRRPARVAPRARGDRTRSDADDRRQPALGRGRSDRAHQRAGALQPVVDRGADQPGRRAGPRGDRAGGVARRHRRRDRRALREPRHLQAAAAGAARSTSARSTAAASAA